MGTGNLLMGDDGVGVHVVQTLRKEKGLPGDVRLIDAGTAALDVLQMLDDIDRLIIVDAVKGGGSPGSIYRFTPQQIEEASSGKISLHQMSLLEALKASEMLGTHLPEVTIVGIEPKTIQPGTNLSIEVAAAIPKAIKTIISLVQ